MRKVLAVLLSAIIALPCAGCQSSPNRAGEGAVIGGILGAGAGAIIGNQSRDRDKGRTQGALIGGALGALGGALAGSQIQKQPAQAQQRASVPSAANPNQISLGQVVDLSREGIHEDVIIDRIRLTNSRYNLTADDLNYLRQNSVSEKVIQVMQGL
jgi:hypothetical protein